MRFNMPALRKEFIVGGNENKLHLDEEHTVGEQKRDILLKRLETCQRNCWNIHSSSLLVGICSATFSVCRISDCLKKKLDIMWSKISALRNFSVEEFVHTIYDK